MRSSRTSLRSRASSSRSAVVRPGLALRPIRAGLLDPVAERRLRQAQIARRGRDRLALIEDQSYRPRLVVIREAPPPPPALRVRHGRHRIPLSEDVRQTGSSPVWRLARRPFPVGRGNSWEGSVANANARGSWTHHRPAHRNFSASWTTSCGGYPPRHPPRRASVATGRESGTPEVDGPHVGRGRAYRCRDRDRILFAGVRNDALARPSRYGQRRVVDSCLLGQI